MLASQKIINEFISNIPQILTPNIPQILTPIESNIREKAEKAYDSIEDAIRLLEEIIEEASPQDDDAKDTIFDLEIFINEITKSFKKSQNAFNHIME